MAAPLFIVAPGRTYTSLISTMLGQHPQAFGLPELNLNAFDTMQRWWDMAKRSPPTGHGLFRAVAQLHHGHQDPATIVAAQSWLRARTHWSTDKMYRDLADRINPRVIVEKSPLSLVIDGERCMERLIRFFPDARFLHLTRHPRSSCKSVLKTEHVKRIVAESRDAYDLSTTPPTFDPQKLWLQAHARIRQFIGALPSSHGLTMPSETFLTQPDRHLVRVASWLGLRTGRASIDEMKHPERSPFARPGPANAPYGNDLGFMRDPKLRPFRAEPESLEGPLEWRNDGCGFLPEVDVLAREFGYT